MIVSFGKVADRERKHPRDEAFGHQGASGKEASRIRGARTPGRRVARAFLGLFTVLRRLALGPGPIEAFGLGRLARGTEPRPMVPTEPYAKLPSPRRRDENQKEYLDPSLRRRALCPGEGVFAQAKGSSPRRKASNLNINVSFVPFFIGQFQSKKNKIKTNLKPQFEPTKRSQTWEELGFFLALDYLESFNLVSIFFQFFSYSFPSFSSLYMNKESQEHGLIKIQMDLLSSTKIP